MSKVTISKAIDSNGNLLPDIQRDADKVAALRTSGLLQEQINQKRDEFLSSRQAAYHAKGWYQPWDFVDHILAVGLDRAFADRAEIKAAIPNYTDQVMIEVEKFGYLPDARSYPKVKVNVLNGIPLLRKAGVYQSDGEKWVFVE